MMNIKYITINQCFWKTTPSENHVIVLIPTSKILEENENLMINNWWFKFQVKKLLEPQIR